MTTPSWAEVEQFLDSDLEIKLAPWQKAMVASMLSGPPTQPLSFQSATSRGWGRHTVDRWAMFSCHHFNLHTHFIGREATICVAKSPPCPDTVPFTEEMKP